MGSEFLKIGDIVTTLYERLNTGQRGMYTKLIYCDHALQY